MGWRRARTLRAQVNTAIVVIVGVSVLLFAIPLAVVAGRLFESQAMTALQRDATRAAAGVPDDVLAGGRRAVAAAPDRGHGRRRLRRDRRPRRRTRAAALHAGRAGGRRA